MTVIQPLTAINGRVLETKYFVPKQNKQWQKCTILECFGVFWSGLWGVGGGEIPAEMALERVWQ